MTNVKLYKFYFILLCLLNSSCTNRSYLEEKRKLYWCKVEVSARDDIINSLYYKIKVLQKDRKKIEEKTNVKIKKNNSLFKICRKSLLDCRVSKSNLNVRINELKDIIRED